MPTILIVDDVVENVRLLKALVQEMGQVVFARDGRSAIELADRHSPDLVLLDVMMPGLDGYETCRALKSREATRDIPVIFITGADGAVEEARGLDLGAIDYITKPFNAEVVRARVRNQLALVQARDDLRRANEELRRLAVTDVLTGLANRRRLMEAGEQERVRALRSGEPLSLLLVDIDHFKKVNDTWGHPAGDEVIRMVATCLSQAVRVVDVAARMGGEEFAVLLPMTAARGAAELAERIRAAVEAKTVTFEGHEMRVTISVGVAEGHGPADFGELVNRADRALYRAKSAGRNRVIVAGDVPVGESAEAVR